MEPFVDVALKGVFTGGILEPIGHFISGGGGKHSKHHHTHKHYKHPHHNEPHHSLYHSPHHSPYDHHHERHHEFSRYGGQQLFYPAHGGYHHCHHHAIGHHHSEPHGHFGGPLYAIGGEGLHHHGEFEYDDDIEHYIEHH